MGKFFHEYLKPGNKVLDVGSRQYGGGVSYRSLLPQDAGAVSYEGLDVTSGKNVDIVGWDKCRENHYDIVISGQTFEHARTFWKLFEDMVRATRPGGHVCVIAPSAGPIHKYPVDCWRFLPDGMEALANYAGVELLKSYLDNEGTWKDCVGIFKK